MSARWLLLILTVANNVSAECPAASLEVEPLRGKRPSRPWLVLGLQGQLANEAVVDQLVFRRDQTRIKVESISTASGANWRQVVVTPATPGLSPGAWTLEALPDSPLARVLSNRLRVAGFEVTSEADRVPALTEARVVGVQSTQPGCGAATFAEVAVATTEPQSLVEVTLTAPSFTTTVVLPVVSRPLAGPLRGNETVVRIGFDMCGGPVQLPAETTFTASLTPLSAGGRPGSPFLVIFSTPPGAPQGPPSLSDTLRAFKTLGTRSLEAP